MALAGDHVLVVPVGQRKARLAPECADRRRSVAQPAREQARGDGDETLRAGREREREYLFLAAAVGIQRLVGAGVEQRGMRLAQRESLVDDVQLRAPIAEIREQRRWLRRAFNQFVQ